VFQDPRVVAESLPLCYPADYYTHLDYNPGRPVECSRRPCSSVWARGRAALARDVKSAALGAPRPGLRGLLGRLLARSTRCREMAFADYTTDDHLPHRVPDELLPRTPDRRRALEVGCGSGYLLVSLKCVGWQAEGVEWDPAAARIARRATGLPVREGDFRRLDLPEGAYDLVVLEHVFEHLDEPVPALARIRDLLAVGGRAVLYYPNPESLGARIFRDAWHPWEAPRHLVLPPAGALAKAAQGVGLAAVRVGTNLKGAAEWFAYSRWHRAGKAIDLRAWPQAGWRDRLIALAERALIGLGFRLGEEVVLVLEKRPPPGKDNG
jgi:SAM-dependent methyltransferase